MQINKEFLLFAVMNVLHTTELWSLSRRAMVLGKQDVLKANGTSSKLIINLVWNKRYASHWVDYQLDTPFIYFQNIQFS